MAGNNDFSINIQIGLQDQGKQLLTEWEKIKKTISDDKLSIKFTDNINESLKQITQMSGEINKLNQQISSMNNNKVNINANDLVNNLKKTLDTSEAVRENLSSFGKVTINSNSINEIDNKMRSLIATVEIANQKFKLLYSAIDQNNGKEEEFNVIGYQFEKILSIVDNTDKILKQSAEKEVQNSQKLQDAIGKVIQKREEENEILEKNQANAINKSLEQEYKDREKIQEQINKTIKLREQENKTLEEKQSKASNKGLDENYNNIQKFVSQSENQLNKLQEKFKGLYSNLEFTKIKDEFNNLLPNDSDLENKFGNISEKIKQLSTELTERGRIQSLGNNVGSFSSSGLSMSSDINEVDKYVKSVLGAKASVSSLSESEDKLGNSVKIANVSFDEGNNIFSKYKMVLDESTQSSYLSSKSVEDLSSKHSTLSEQIGNALNGFLRFQLAAGGTMAVINSLKQGLQEIADINKSNINVAMITDDSVENVEKGNQALLKLAENLKVVNSEVLAGQESWMRSGVSQEEANKNLETTTKLSKIAGVANQEMADSLIVIKNAYDLNSTALEGYASKVSLLDNQSATSSQKINSAMQYSAQTFKAVGIDMDTALSWITNYSEKSAESGQAIGNHFKSLLENFHKLKAGFKSQDEDSIQSVNKLEDLLDSKGIALRKNKDEWNDLGTVIKQIQENIGKFTDVQKSDLAFKIGGKENAEATLATLNNMQRINELNDKLKSDNGAKALNESYEKYKQGMEAQLANLKNSLTGFWQQTISSSTINSTISGLNNLVNTITSLTHNFGLVPTVITTASVALMTFDNNLKILNANNEINNNSKLVGMFNNIKNGLDNTSSSWRKHYEEINSNIQQYGKFTDVSNRAKAGIMTLGDGMNALANSEKVATIATTAFNAVIGLGIGVAISLAIEGIMKLINKIGDTEKSITDLQSEMNITKQNDQLINKYEDLEKQLGSMDKTSQQYKDTQNQIVDVQKQLAQAFPSLVDGYTKEGDAIATNVENLKKYNEQKKIQIMAEAGKDYNTLKNDLTKSQTNGYVDAKVGTGENYGSLIDQYNQNRKLMDDAISKGDNTLASEYASKIKSVSVEIDKFNQSSIQLYNIGMKDVDYFDTASGKMVKYSDYLADNTNKTKDNTKAKQDNTNVDITNGMKSISELESNFAKSLGDVRKEITPINQALKDHAENGQWDMDTILKLAESYPELLDKMNDDKALEKELIKIKNDKMQATKDELKTQIDTLTKTISNYGIDVSKYQTAEEMKTAILKTQVAERLNALKKEMDEMDLENYKKQHPELTASQAEDNFARGQMRTGDLYGQEYNKVLSPVDSLFKAKDLEKQFDSAINQTSDDLKKNSSSTKKNKEATDALNDSIKAIKNEMQSYENMIKGVDNAINSLESNMAGMSETSDEYINSLKSENELFKQRISLVNSATNANNSYIGSIGSMGGVSGSALGSQIVQEASSFLGTPYKWASNDPTNGGFDCSGLVQYIYKQVGIELGRSTYDQVKEGNAVSKEQLQPGDIVFFGNPSAPEHEGVYIGNGNFIESPHTGSQVKISDLNSRSDYATARRIVSDTGSSSTSSTPTPISNTVVPKGGFSSANEFLSAIMPYAQAIKQKYNITPSLLLSQAMAESADGSSYLARTDNNYFGMTWTGNNGQKGSARPEGGNYVHYNNMAESVEAYGKLLASYYGVNGDDFNSGLEKVASKGYAADPSYRSLVKTKYSSYNLSQYDSGNYPVADLANTANGEIESILSKNQDYAKQNIDFARKIQENNTKIFNAYVGQFDEKLAHVDRNKEMAQSKYDISKDNTTQAGLEESEKQSAQIWKEINWHYSVLDEKEKYITSQLYSNDYDEKTKTSMLQTLEQVRIQKTQTVKDLHTEFKSWIEETYANSIKPYQTNIEQLQSQLDILGKSSNKSYQEKIDLNSKIYEQEEQIKQKTLEKMDAVQKLIDKENDDNTRELWKQELDTLKKDYDDIISKQVDLNNTKIQLAEDSAMKQIEKAMYNGETKTSFENNIKAQINALDDQLEIMQKQSEQLQEQETRQKNLLSLAEAQVNLQKAQDEHNVQQLTKDKNGNWQFSYVANQQNVDSLEQSVRDKIQSNNDYQRQLTEKHQEEAINDQKKALQAEIDIRNEAYSTIKSNLDDAINNQENAFSTGTVTINGIVTKSLSDLQKIYNGKYSSIVSTTTSALNTINGVLTTLTSNIVNAQSATSAIATASATTTTTPSPSGSSSSSGSRDVTIGGGNTSSIYVSGGKTYHYDSSRVNIEKAVASGAYDKGGEAYGIGTMVKDTLKPERVLDPEQTSAFNELVYKILPDMKALNFDNLVIPNALNNISLPDFSSITSKATQAVNNIMNLSSLTLNCPNVVDGESFIQTLRNIPNLIAQSTNSNK